MSDARARTTLWHNPVLRRELFGILRTRRSLALLGALTVSLALLLALRWPADGQVDLQGDRAQEVFCLLGCGLAAGVLLLVPAFPATSVVNERRGGTLALLFNTSLRPWQVYVGKLLASLLYVGLLLVATLPAAAACYAMGGISLDADLGMLYLVVAAAAVQYTALSLLVSTLAVTADAALRWAYGLTFTLSVLTMAPHYFLQGKAGLLPRAAWHLYCLSPLPQVMEVLQLGGFGPHGIRPPSTGWWEHWLLGSLLTLTLVTLGLLRLRPRLLDQSRSAGVMTQDRTVVQRVGRRLFFLVDPQRRKGGIWRLLNPVMVKEFRTRRFGRSHWLLRLMALCAIVSMALTYATTTSTMDRGLETIGSILVVLQVSLVVLVTPSLASGLISGERESGAWELLQLTPLSALRIASGKLISVLATLLLILLATLPGYVVFVLIDGALMHQVVRVMICLVLTAVYCLLLGAALGSLFSRTAASTAAAYGALMLIFGGSVLVWLARDMPFGRDLVRSALLLNPGAAALSVMGFADLRDYDLLPATWWLVGGLAAGLLCLLVVQTWRLNQPE